MASGWPIEDARLDEPDLDLRNVRIPDDELDQSAIVSYMVEAEDVLELARDILRDGTWTMSCPSSSTRTADASCWREIAGLLR
jgi:hypothetical protein